MSKKIIKKKISECCKAPMLGGVQCENCGSNGKFNNGTAVIKRMDKIIKILSSVQYIDLGEVDIKRTSEHSPIWPTAPSKERFIDCGEYIKDTWEHTMQDGKKVKLMWQKEDAPERLKNDGPAEEYCKNSKVGGFDDWKLPEVDELQTLINKEKKDPACDAILNMKPNWYWTKTPYAADPDYYAWVVHFYDGYVNYDYRNYTYYVRPVRQYF